MIETESFAWTAALLVGVVGSVHCVPMCGGIAGALGQTSGAAGLQSPIARSGLYSTGRITSYSLVGAIAGGAGHGLEAISGSGPLLRILAGLLIIAMGLQVSGWWKGFDALQRFGLAFWRRLLPLARSLGPADRGWKILSVGMLWGWLPCGLVYSSVAVASATGSAASGALFMFCFGLGTLPAMVLTSSLSTMVSRFTQRRAIRQSASVLLLLFGAWTILAATSHGHGTGESAPHHHHETINGSQTQSLPDQSNDALGNSRHIS